MARQCRFLSILLTLIFCTCPGALSFGQNPQPLTTEQRQTFDQGLRTLQESLETLRDQSPSEIADATIFAKGLEWALQYDQKFSPREVVLMKKAMVRGKQRIDALTKNKKPWSTRKGKLALGYVSVVDNSVQPYGLIVPESYDSSQPIRLDVVLHGSSRPVGLSELRFIARFDKGDEKQSSVPDKSYIELHPLGRVENCYRWAGETDVFEAIEDVCRRYNIDRRRIVLRGMSMGASGTWHLGLKYPDRFVALGPYCGYVDTHHFSETPLKNFVKVGPLPPHQELGLHMLDSIDYAANAGVVPAIACIGEKDVFFQAHVLMGKAMQQEGLTMVNLISPGTGHVIDPVTHAEQMRRIGLHVAKGLNRQPQQLRFVTWTLKYNRCHWLEVLGLEQHYSKAIISAQLHDDRIEINELQNITRFAIQTSHLPKIPKTLRIDTTELSLSPAGKSGKLIVERRDNTWSIADKVPSTGKRPGLQGPIDDAFSSPFLCVRGTGKPWNAAANEYATASLKRFANEWHHYFRGELPIKDDTDVTEEDIRTRNLILFGDPGSNSYIAKVLPHLPLKWSQKMLRFGNKDYPAGNHVPALIVPNPLSGANGRYIVLNSGHTFREAELAKLNYLLFPRWGDWAVLQIDPSHTESKPLKENVLRAGYFNEQWKLPAE
ncbi:MAG: prolyl oligopeptidase family serine peptidase [Planctomycetes bacterium]|nr:prolyl oligopeptidase family serine peptidase [Planctomycetota bacterium]MCH9723759.1 prolyl oligopeptidase family serine peptidase [Planctomycetota bacterium]MCH9776071.1 prolyl oligopeptidase family serine peptidase [Planctomycetota bacterium]MCH9789812.1 prolyl oligopeptidase family serine peptidase [Planctomycetota bacterium]